MSSTTSAKFYETLSPQKREALFAWMRTQGDRALSLGKEVIARSAPAGTIPVGASFFDYFLKGEGLEQYLSGLRRGENPDGALERALQWSREAVEIHNSRRPKDVCWQRSKTSNDSHLWEIHRSCLRALE